MDHLTLIAGLLLPWLNGAAWFRAVDARLAQPAPGDWARAWGYGFFLGYAFLGLLLLGQSALTGAVTFGPVMAVLALATLAGGFLAYPYRRSVPAGTRAEVSFAALSPAAKALVVLLAAWTLLHLGLALLDELAIPVYPWDAWLLWLYRAKAWFFAGDLPEFVPPAEWLRLEDPAAYTVDAVGYPLLPSLIPLWAALSHGAWSETLVILPAFLCGLTIGLALYGQCRRAGLGVGSGVVVLYLLYSIPLVGTHLALPGYADLWMAGFAGLGFVALLQGHVEGARYPLALGLLFLALGLVVKNEGVIWLAAGLALLFILEVRWWVSLALAAALAFAAVYAWNHGVGPVQLPVGGEFGVVGDRVSLPFVAPFTVKLYSAWSHYAHGLFEMDTWNLAWTLFAATAAVALFSPQRRASRAALAFMLVFCATQFFIFGLTHHGAFSETYTASNRLPLHFLPALLFCAAAVFGHLLRRQLARAPASPRWRRALPPVLAAFAVAAWAFQTVMSREAAPEAGAEPLVFEPGAFRPVAGRWQVQEERLVLQALDGGIAVAALQPVRIDTSEHYLLHVEAEADGPRPIVYWRTRENPGIITPLDLWDNQSDYVDLRRQAAWTGEVTEFGFMFNETGDEPAAVWDVRLGADTPASRLARVIDQWFQPEPWAPWSVNFRAGGAPRQWVYLPALLLAWFLGSLVIGAALLRRDPGGLARVAAFTFLAGWLLLDARWTAARLAEADNALANLARSEREKWEEGVDGKLAAFAHRLKDDYFDREPGRILISNDGTLPPFYGFRIKYLLLPHPSGQGGGQLRPRHFAKVDYVLALHDDAAGRQRVPRDPSSEGFWSRWRAPGDSDRNLRRIESGEFGFLFSGD